MNSDANNNGPPPEATAPMRKEEEEARGDEVSVKRTKKTWKPKVAQLQPTTATASTSTTSSSFESSSPIAVTTPTPQQQRQGQQHVASPATSPSPPPLSASPLSSTGVGICYHHTHSQTSYKYGEVFPLDEDREHEFKAVQRTKRLLDRISVYCEHYVNAFLNTDGGTIYFGIEDDGRILGVPMDRKLRDLLRLRIDSIVSAFKPQVDPYLCHTEFVPVVKALDSRTPQRKAKTSRTRAGSRTEEADIEEEEDDYNEEDEKEIQRREEAGWQRYVVQIRVGRGRAPVYFTPHGSAYFRRSGSTHKMDLSMITSRKEMGRPQPAYGLPHQLSDGDSNTGAQQPFSSSTAAIPQSSAVAGLPQQQEQQPSQLKSCQSGAAVGAMKEEGRGEQQQPCSDKQVLSLKPPEHFIGREQEIEHIRKFVTEQILLTPTTTAGRLGLVLLHGLPVVGKSALARQLMVEFSSLFPDVHYVVDMKGVTTSYSSIADAMVSVIRESYPMATLPDSEGPALNGMYQSCFSGKQCILLLENVGSQEQIKALLPTTPKLCLVLITSRKDLSLDAIMDRTLSVRLGELLPEHAVKLLSTMLPHGSITKEEAQQIARLCGYLPLPMRLIASTLRRKRNITPQSFIKRLTADQSKIYELLQKSADLAEAGYPTEVIDHVKALSLFPSSFDIRSAMALLHLTYEETEDALGVLLDYSLLDFNTANQRYEMNDFLKKRTFALAEKDEQTKQQLATYQERFVQYYESLLRDCTACLSGSDSTLRMRGMLLFARDRQNFEACLKYAKTLKNYRLIWFFSHKLALFLSKLHSPVEKTKFAPLLHTVMASEGVLQAAQKEEEKQHKDKHNAEEKKQDQTK